MIRFDRLPVSRVDRVLLAGIVVGCVAFAFAALQTSFGLNDWEWVFLTRSLSRWVGILGRFENLRVSSQALLGASFTLFGPSGWFPAAILTAANLAGVIFGARVLERLGATRRAAFIAAACAVLCSANSDVTLHLAASETALGRTITLVMLDRALDDRPDALRRAIPWMALLFFTHESAMLALPLVAACLVVRRRPLHDRRGATLFVEVWSALAVIRLALYANAPASTHQLGLSRVTDNVRHFTDCLRQFVVGDHRVLAIAVLAVVLGLRPSREDLQKLGTICGVSLVFAVLAFAPYFAATAYRTRYFFTAAAFAAAAPLGWFFDSALTALEDRPSRAVILAIGIAVATMLPALTMHASPEIRACTRAAQAAARDAIARDAGASGRCLWLVSPAGHATIPNGGLALAALDVGSDQQSTMLKLLHPQTTFVVKEILARDFARAPITKGDAIVRFEDGRIPFAEVPNVDPHASAATGRCR